MFPKINLAIDNCFAYKRWTEPREWIQIIKDTGINFIEASADNEFDPLYTPPDVQRDWIDAVQSAEQRFSARICNLYSGHGTYTTLGLAHPDVRVRNHIQHKWLEPMIQHAAALGSGIGFYCHGFSQATLADPDRYQLATVDLVVRLAALAQYAAEHGVKTPAVEQMYTPHQIPWTIGGTRTLLRDVYAGSGVPFYITLDTGHQIGQQRFLRPSVAAIEQYVHALDGRQPSAEIWMGYHNLFPAEAAHASISEVTDYVERHPYLFCDPVDGKLDAWMTAFGAYSPIIHLQQTNGTVSAHHPFTVKFNREGIVSPQRVLSALYQAYLNDPDDQLPPRCQDIYLTLEIFSGTAEQPGNILSSIRESVAYWRKFVPEDGLTLDRLIQSSIK